MRRQLAMCLTLLIATTTATKADRYGKAGPIPGAEPTSPNVADESLAAAPSDFATRMTALELALASTIAEPPAAWRLDALIAEAGELSGVASDDAQRLAARDVSTRLEGFAQIARRSQLAAAPTGDAAAPSGKVAWRSPRGGSGADALAERTRPANDVAPTTGVLRPVVSQRPGAPSFAVVNTEGQIAAFVTPKPEIKAKLDSLVGRRVSLGGSGDYRLDVPTRPMVADRRTAGGTRLR